VGDGHRAPGFDLLEEGGDDELTKGDFLLTSLGEEHAIFWLRAPTP
jgi:hypothetical protein